MKENVIPKRDEIPESDKWDLSTLYLNYTEWEQDLQKIPVLADEIVAFKGSLNNPKTLLSALKKYESLIELSEKTGNFAFLMQVTDAENSEYQRQQTRYIMVATEAEAKISFFQPEIQTIPTEIVNQWINTAEFKNYSIYLKKLLHLKPYILSEKEERLLTLQSEANETAKKTFSLLTNVDLEFGSIQTEKGSLPLSLSTFSSFMENPNREIREKAYKQFYKQFDTHKNTIASLYIGSVNLDVYKAKARGYSSSLQAALYKDNVSLSVYDNLIATVRNNLAPLHKYYSLRKKILKLNELRHYDVYTPLVQNVSKVISYDEAVSIIHEALSPLGEEYTQTLTQGLKNGWVDKYENKGKRSGAFSAGGYNGYPYILMNYKADSLRDVFTLAHEGGHSMHSWYSAKNNPIMHYDYTIFEAEVASTFNEELVFQYLLKTSTDKETKAYLLSNRAADILATLYRQTMFAEFEKITHEMVENGEPLTTDILRSVYKNLLVEYFGPEMVFENESDLEALRIPHFYNAFYVYKYATGISAALALAQKVLNGGEDEKNAYFSFLKSGGSRYPIDSLKLAGVDMEKTEPIEKAIQQFEKIIHELEQILE